jgi:hypothetical protein
LTCIGRGHGNPLQFLVARAATATIVASLQSRAAGTEKENGRQRIPAGRSLHLYRYDGMNLSVPTSMPTAAVEAAAAVETAAD